LEYHLFAFFAYLGAMIWTATFILLGSLLGESWKRLAGEYSTELAAGILILLAAGLVCVVYFWRKRRKTERP
jgi:membrane protein DedA with SNARE-associated domain